MRTQKFIFHIQNQATQKFCSVLWNYSLFLTHFCQFPCTKEARTTDSEDTHNKVQYIRLDTASKQAGQHTAELRLS